MGGDGVVRFRVLSYRGLVGLVGSVVEFEARMTRAELFALYNAGLDQEELEAAEFRPVRLVSRRKRNGLSYWPGNGWRLWRRHE